LARKAKKRKPSLEWFKIKVTATAISVDHRGPGLSPLHPDGDADSNIKIEGTLDHPVLNRNAALLCVFCGAEIGNNPGSAIGATTAWQVVLRLPREQFADLLTIIIAKQLSEVDLLLEGLSRGRGAVRSASFHTDPVPSERDEDTDEAQS
jgi:hypothetical protein